MGFLSVVGTDLLGRVAGGLLAGWYYVDRMIPDRVSIVEEEKEDFSFPLPFFTTLSSDSQEVALGNESNIPADQITISGNQLFPCMPVMKALMRWD